MQIRNHFHYQASNLSIINREGIITYLLVLKIAKKVILKKPPPTKLKLQSV